MFRWSYLLPRQVTNWLYRNAFIFPNVIGFSEAYLPKVIMGQVINVPTVKFYVSKKVDKSLLLDGEVIPEFLSIRNRIRKSEFRTDVVELGPVKALIDKTKNFRPVELGVSVGNEKITAGSLGMLYRSDLDGKIYAGTNAHVGTPNAGWTVEEVINSGFTRILQRGSYHGGVVSKDVAGRYVWHQKIYGTNDISNCQVAGGVTRFLDLISGVLRRKTRFLPIIPIINTIDFAIYEPTVEHILKIADDSIDPEKMFAGHLFAGSDQSGIIHKIAESLKIRPDLKPANGNWGDVKVGDRVKGCSFWCNYETDVTDVNGVINVGYGDFLALFNNLIVVKNDGIIKGGWSGSGWFKID